MADPDWNAEFRRFTADKSNYQDTLIVLSAGPYSNVAAADAKMPEEEWLEKSIIIRQYHECTHVICRKRWPDKIDAVWDELVADAIGIYAAYGRFDAGLEEKGIEFSLDEIRRLKERSNKYQNGEASEHMDDGELSEDELMDVAGGLDAEEFFLGILLGW